MDDGDIPSRRGSRQADVVNREQQNRVGPVMRLVVERLPHCPATVFSRGGEVLLRNRLAIVLFGRHGVTVWRYRHVLLGELVLHRQALVDPVDRQLLVVLAAVPGSPTDVTLRSL